jgi:predicted metal-binding membrane protein
VTRTAATPLALLAVAAASWVLAVQQMQGMDMGAATELGSLPSFAATWGTMMAAMMLPGAVRFARTVLFAAAYLSVWAVVGLAVYVVYRPHGTVAAGIVTFAAGVYELTPLKRRCRERCRELVRSGFGFGLYCVGSSIGLMALLLALGAMSVTWMAIAAAILIAQKLLPPQRFVDVPLALAISVLGVVIATQ